MKQSEQLEVVDATYADIGTDLQTILTLLNDVNERATGLSDSALCECVATAIRKTEAAVKIIGNRGTTVRRAVEKQKKREADEG